ncbi:type IV secretion system protein [Aeromonas veronii]|uniref:type IV secretion system protein n=1 Tax=Aeromonas TaxID=642 RepID=UPI0034139490
MEFDFFAQFFAKINGAVMGYITAISDNVYDIMIPVISGCMGIVIIWMALKTFMGQNNDPFEEMLLKTLWMAVVTSLAGVGGIYQRDLAPVVLNLPETISLGLIGTSATDINLLDRIAINGVDKSLLALDKFIDSPLSGILWLIVAAVYIVCTGYMVLIGGGFIMVSKIMVGLLAALGPIFIYSLLFEASKRFFASWLNQIMYYSAMILFFSVIYGFFMDMFDRYTANLSWDSSTSNMIYSTLGAVFMGVMAHRALKEIPRLSASISNGFHIDSLMSLRGGGGRGKNQK